MSWKYHVYPYVFQYDAKKKLIKLGEMSKGKIMGPSREDIKDRKSAQ